MQLLVVALAPAWRNSGGASESQLLDFYAIAMRLLTRRRKIANGVGHWRTFRRESRFWPRSCVDVSPAGVHFFRLLLANDTGTAADSTSTPQRPRPDQKRRLFVALTRRN